MAAARTRRARRRDVPGRALARSPGTPFRIAAGLLAVLLELSCSESKIIIEATLTGVPDSAASLRVNALLDRKPTKEPPSEIRKPPASSLTYFRAEVPVSETGELKLDVLALGADECAVSAGAGSLQLDGPGTYSTTIEMGATTGCQLVITKVGEGSGSVRVINGSEEKTYTFDRPPQEMPSCPQPANYPSSQTLTLPIRSHVRLMASVSDESQRGSLFGSWGQACKGRTACELDISEVQTMVSVSFYSNTLCASSGVCWHHPLPQGNTLRRVAGREAGDVWAVGDRGTIVRWNGSYWTSPRRPFDTSPLNGVWVEALPNTSLIAVGDQGVARPFSDDTWACAQSVGPVTLRDAWGSGFKDVWAVGDQGALLHWDGSSWTRHASPAGPTIGLNAVAGRSSKDAWAAGEQGTLLRYDGTSWSRVQLPITDTLYGLWLDPGGELWAVGDNGVSLRLPSASGSPVAEVNKTGTTARLHGLWGVSAQELWAAGAFGTILKWNGTSWSSYASDTGADLFSIWGAAPDDIWAVGRGGAMVHFNGSFWQGQSVSHAGETINALWGLSLSSGQPMSGSGLVAFGDRGQIFSWTGGDWVLAAAPGSLTSRSLRAAWGASTNDVWIVGDAGTAARWNGSQAVLVATGISSDLHALWGQSSSDLYAVGQSGTLARYDGTRWTAMALPAAAGSTLRAIWGASPSELWIAGDNGTLLRWNGSSAAPVASGTVRTLRSLSGTGRGDVWAVGDGGTFLHYEVAVPELPRQTFRALRDHGQHTPRCGTVAVGTDSAPG
jgi:hypothetical protein